jgi:hypothetical protein
MKIHDHYGELNPNFRHGLCQERNRLPEYGIWQAIKSRCRNPNNKSYPWYGGRGIDICPEWATDFSAFLSGIGRRPLGPVRYTLDRINNSDGYKPGNTRWVTFTENARNQRSNRPVIRGDGARYETISEAIEKTGGVCSASGIHRALKKAEYTCAGYTWRNAQ